MVHPTVSNRIENLNNGLSSFGSFSAKIDDRGRIYLPARIRRFCKSVSFLNSSTRKECQEFEKKSGQVVSGISFFAAVAERRIFISGNGRYGVDPKNRIFIPADIRRSLGLNAGDIIKIEFGGDEK